MRLSEIAPVLGASSQGDAVIQGVSTDSRTLKAGNLFVAIVGANHDGHDFIAAAILRGAAAVLVSRPVAGLAVPIIKVLDTQKALGALAAYWRQQFRLPVIAITGSCGKTTVKTMTSAIMQQMGPSCVTEGNLNNEIGVPLTVLGLSAEDHAAVLELGAARVGDIAYLGTIVRPTIALVTCVAPAHLKGFGSIEQIAHAKGELYTSLSPEGIAIINLEEPAASLWRSLAGNRAILTFGLDPKADIYATELELYPLYSCFKIHTPIGSASIQLNIPGHHNIVNALGACAAAYAAGATLGAMVDGLKAATAVKGRLQVLEGPLGMRVIDDSYNANPGSVRAALEVLAHFPGERVFVLGNMAELGPDEEHFHSEIGVYAKRFGIERLMGIGDLALAAVKTFGEGGLVFQSMDELITALNRLASKELTVLIKGSRSSGMDRVVRSLTEEV